MKPQNAARRFASPAPVLSRPRCACLFQEPGKRIIEYGAGCLRNALTLLPRNHVTVVELEATVQRFSEEYGRFVSDGGQVALWSEHGPRPAPRTRHFDLAICTFVLETICDPTIRRQVLADCRERLRQDGCLILSVRGPSDVLTARRMGVPHSDGFVTPQGTFVRAYTIPQVRELLVSCGFHSTEFLHKPSNLSPELVHVLAS